MIYWPIPLVVFLIVWYGAKRYSRLTKNSKILLAVPALSIVVTTILMALYRLLYSFFHGTLTSGVYPGDFLPRLAEELYFTLAFATVPIQVVGGHLLVNRSLPSKLKPKPKWGMLSLLSGIIGVYIGVLLFGYVVSLFVFAPIAVVSGIIYWWRKRDGYALTGLTLGVFLILFWVVLGKSFYAGWT